MPLLTKVGSDRYYLNIVTQMKHEDPQKIYSDWSKLGNGSFGVVYVLAIQLGFDLYGIVTAQRRETSIMLLRCWKITIIC